MSLKSKLSAYFNRGSNSQDVLTEDPAYQRAVMPFYLYRPPFGRPRNIDVDEIRRLGRTPFVYAVINTISNEVTSQDWEIVANPRAGEKPASDKEIDQVTDFFLDPNENNENLSYLLKQAIEQRIGPHHHAPFNSHHPLFRPGPCPPPDRGWLVALCARSRSFRRHRSGPFPRSGRSHGSN